MKPGGVPRCPVMTLVESSTFSPVVRHRILFSLSDLLKASQQAPGTTAGLNITASLSLQHRSRRTTSHTAALLSQRYTQYQDFPRPSRLTSGLASGSKLLSNVIRSIGSNSESETSRFVEAVTLNKVCQKFHSCYLHKSLFGPVSATSRCNYMV